MVESVGKRLNRARLERQISVEEAAHATKMRAERVLDLENDDYTNFPSLAYAKGFLIIYAKYLGVDVSDFAGNLNASGRFGIEDYEYLHNAPAPLPPIARRKPKRSLKPVIIVAIAIAGTVWVMNFQSKIRQLGDLDELAKKETNPAHGQTAQPAPTPAPAGAAFITPKPVVTPLQQQNSEDKAFVDGSVAVRRAEPVETAPATTQVQPPAQPSPQPAPQPSSEAAVQPTPAPAVSTSTAPRVNDITLQPLKKTWVKITAQKGDATPIFEDWLYPDAPPLKFRGGKFWIELGDKDGVQIIRNGEPVPYQHPGITVE
jgi:cytoskeletal protein RodZ